MLNLGYGTEKEEEEEEEEPMVLAREEFAESHLEPTNNLSININASLSVGSSLSSGNEDSFPVMVKYSDFVSNTSILADSHHDSLMSDSRILDASITEGPVVAANYHPSKPISSVIPRESVKDLDLSSKSNSLAESSYSLKNHSSLNRRQPDQNDNHEEPTDSNILNVDVESSALSGTQIPADRNVFLAQDSAISIQTYMKTSVDYMEVDRTEDGKNEVINEKVVISSSSEMTLCLPNSPVLELSTSSSSQMEFLSFDHKTPVKNEEGVSLSSRDTMASDLTQTSPVPATTPVSTISKPTRIRLVTSSSHSRTTSSSHLADTTSMSHSPIQSMNSKHTSSIHLHNPQSTSISPQSVSVNTSGKSLERVKQTAVPQTTPYVCIPTEVKAFLLQQTPATLEGATLRTAYMVSELADFTDAELNLFAGRVRSLLGLEGTPEFEVDLGRLSLSEWGLVCNVLSQVSM
jgi:hypothetical protein